MTSQTRARPIFAIDRINACLAHLGLGTIEPPVRWEPISDMLSSARSTRFYPGFGPWLGELEEHLGIELETGFFGQAAVPVEQRLAAIEAALDARPRQ